MCLPIEVALLDLLVVVRLEKPCVDLNDHEECEEDRGEEREAPTEDCAELGGAFEV